MSACIPLLRPEGLQDSHLAGHIRRDARRHVTPPYRDTLLGDSDTGHPTVTVSHPTVTFPGFLPLVPVPPVPPALDSFACRVSLLTVATTGEVPVTRNTAFAGALAALVMATCAQAQEAKRTLMPENDEARAFQEAVGYSDAVIHGDTVILSGVVAVPVEGDDGMEPSFVRVFEAIGRTLERAGANWDDVIEIETFHTDLAGQINAFAEVKNRYIKAPFPAWTAIGISALYEPTALVEVKVTARLPQGGED